MSRADKLPDTTQGIGNTSTLLSVLLSVALERAMGIEPTSEAWEASILPLYDARSFSKLAEENPARKLGLREMLVAEATHQVVVDQAGGLHEGVDDGGADETEAALF